MEIVPVLDVMRGEVVHAVAGDRSRYGPVRDSVLVSSSDPCVLLERVCEMGFKRVYIADLDAIMHNIVTVDEIVRHAHTLGLEVLVDAGRAGLARADEPNVTYVIGTEYLRPDELQQVTGRALSLDMDGVHVRTLEGHLHYRSVLSMLTRHRPRLVIMLRLDLVGTGRGLDDLTVRVIEDLERALPETEILYGGGVRGVEDLIALARLHVRGVLVATALHRGSIVSPVLCVEK